MKKTFCAFFRHGFVTLALMLVVISSLILSPNTTSAAQVCAANLGGSFSFANPVTEVNTGEKLGHVYRFRDVLSGVDALVEIVATEGAWVQSMDSTNHIPAGIYEAMQPDILIRDGFNEGHVDFKITFVNAGTSQPYAFPANAKYTVSGLDVDGDNSDVREYVGFKGFTSYVLENNTKLTPQSNSGYQEFLSDVSNLPGVTTSGTEHIVTAKYDNVSQFFYRAGIRRSNANGNTTRFFSLYFGCITYNDPKEPPPVDPPAGSNGNGRLLYANSGTGKYKDRILFMDWENSALQDGIQEGDTVEFAIPASSCLASGKLTATFQNVDDPESIASQTKPHDMKTWNGASFYTLYNTPGNGEALYTPQVNPSNGGGEHHLTFDIVWNMVIDGETVAPDLFVFDPESTTYDQERLDFTTNGGAWSVIENAVGDAYIVAGLGTQAVQILKTETDNTNMQSQETGWSPLLLTKGATQTSIALRTINGNGGLDSVAFALLAPCDRGDAPASYGDATHAFKETPISPSKTELGLTFEAGTPYIGAIPPDSEFSQNDVDAQADDLHYDYYDTTRNDDEDGIQIEPLSQGASRDVSVVVNGQGYLQAWFDWNGDGDFDDAGEQVATDVSGTTGSITLGVSVPSDAKIGKTYARFRYSSQQGIGSSGKAKDGEVEDVKFEIKEGGVCYIDDLSPAMYSTSAVAANANYLSSRTRVYQAGFDNSDWTGHLQSYDLKTENKDGNVKTLQWDVATSLSKTGRTILSYNPDLATTQKGIDFNWDELSSGQKTALQAGGSVATAQKRIDWIKGDQSNEGSLFRSRNSLMGDIVHSGLRFQGNYDNYGYKYMNATEKSSYATFLTQKKTRKSVIYVGANDGMLHAFDANTGSELFAYIPNAVFPKLAKISDPKYGCTGSGCLKHEYLVDGSTTVGDAYVKGSWRTIAVGTLGLGGQGLFALDVTDPENMSKDTVLWEISATQNSAYSQLLGNTLPTTSIVRMNDGHWAAIVANGYDSQAKTAALFIIDIETGDLIKKFVIPAVANQTNGMSTPTPVDTNSDYIADAIYAGDLLGNLWVFDVSNADPANWAVKFGSNSAPEPLFKACEYGSCGTAQAITAAPQIGRHPDGGLMVYFGTGKYFDVSDNMFKGAGPAVSAFYGIRDKGVKVQLDQLVEQKILHEVSVNTDFNSRVTSTYPVDYASKQGWYMTLVSPDSNPAAASRALGERVISQALLRDGRLIFTTMVPPMNECILGGKSWIMELNALDGRRLNVIPFDTNNDKEFTKADNVDIDDTSTIISGVQKPSLGVIFSTPAVITHTTRTEGKYVTGTGGSIGMFRESASRFSGRMSWRKLR